MDASTGAVALTAVITFSLCSASSGAFAQAAYPNRPVRIVVPTPPGGGNDMVARMIAQGLTERLARQVIVENRAGAGTIIGTELVARAQPDGYTLLMGPGALATNPTSYRKLPYDAIRDFAPVTQAVAMPSLLTVHPSLPARSVKELIALAQARPGEILFASAGIGTPPHLAMELFASMAKVRLTHVPYKGSNPGLIDLLAGQVAVMGSNMLETLPHVRAARLRALGVTAPRRVAAAPEIPAVAESGLPGYEASQWYGLLAPAGTPPEIVMRLHKEAAATLRAPENTSRLISQGSEVVASTPDDFRAFIRSETAKWSEVARAAGIKPE